MRPLTYLIIALVNFTLIFIIAQLLRDYYFNPVNNLIATAETRHQDIYREVVFIGNADDFRPTAKDLPIPALSWVFGIATGTGVIFFLGWLMYTFTQDPPDRSYFFLLLFFNILFWSILIPEASLELLFGQINSSIINFFKT